MAGLATILVTSWVTTTVSLTASDLELHPNRNPDPTVMRAVITFHRFIFLLGDAKIKPGRVAFPRRPAVLPTAMASRSVAKTVDKLMRHQQPVTNIVPSRVVDRKKHGELIWRRVPVQASQTGVPRTIDYCSVRRKAIISRKSSSLKAGFPPFGGISTPVVLAGSLGERPFLIKASRSLSFMP